MVRLPFDERFAARLGLDADTWLTGVRDAIADLSDFDDFILSAPVGVEGDAFDGEQPRLVARLQPGCDGAAARPSTRSSSHERRRSTSPVTYPLHRVGQAEVKLVSSTPAR